MVTGYGNCTGRNRGIDEARAIGLVAGEREKQIAGLDRAAVDREARDVHRISLRVDPGVIAEKVAKSHSLGPAGRAARRL